MLVHIFFCPAPGGCLFPYCMQNSAGSWEGGYLWKYSGNIKGTMGHQMPVKESGNTGRRYGKN